MAIQKKEIVELFDKFEKPLVRFAFLYLKDTERAMDLVQEVFIKLMKQEEVPENVSAWLYRVARNLSIDWIRKGKKVVITDSVEALDKPILEDDPLVHEENMDNVRKAMFSLADTEREMVALKYYQNKSYKEISVITGKTITNVGYILHQAMKHLKNEYLKIENKNVMENQ